MWGLTWPEILGIVGAAGSGVGAALSAWLAVRQAKIDTRRDAEADCQERLERLARLERVDE